MNGLEIFLLAGVCSIVVFYFVSLTILSKQFKKVTYLTPAIIVTVVSSVFLVSSFFLVKDGWVIMGNAFLVFSVIAGTFIGTFLPFLHPKYKR